MPHRHFAQIAAIAFLGLVASAACRSASSAQPANKPAARKLLYPATLDAVAPHLKADVERLLSADQKPVDPAGVKFRGVYTRIISRPYAIEDGKPKRGGWLGSRPFVYLTVPEVAYGRNLLGTLAAIGYDLEDILETEKGTEKVAVVFAYPDPVRPTDAKDGFLLEDWQQRVYSATWDNLLSLVDHLASDKARSVVRPEGDAFLPTKFQFRSDRELSFLLGFPAEGMKRVKTTDYAALREVGGADWVYRQLIERLMGASEHYRGDGRTKLTLAGKRKPRAGFPEYLGPNAELTALPVMAIIGLGTIRVEE